MTGRAQQESPLSLSLVIPAYNEASRLGAGMGRLRRAIEAGAIEPHTTEIVVVDDGSTDETSAKASDLLSDLPHVRVLRLPINRGKGAAVRAGVAAARAPLIAFADADMAIDPTQAPSFVEALDRADLAIGSRAASGSSVDRASIKRSATNRAFNAWVNVVTRVSLADTQCGFKAFRAPAAKLLFHCTVTERFAFDVELLALARRLGLSISEIPVRWSRVEGSRIRLRRDAFPMARDVLRASRVASDVPPMAALRVKVPDLPEITSAVPDDLVRHLPVLALPDGTDLLVCTDADDDVIATISATVRAAQPDAMIEPQSVSTAWLRDHAPLALRWSTPGDQGPRVG